MELTEFAAPTPANLPAALFEPSVSNGNVLPLVDRDATEAEWAAQEALPEYGRNPYQDRLTTEAATQNQDAITRLDTPPLILNNGRPSGSGSYSTEGAHGFDMYASEAAPVGRSPYASPTLQQELDAQFHNAPYVAPSADRTLSTGVSSEDRRQPSSYAAEPEPPVHTLAPDAQAEEIARAVSVAVAFFEDNLSASPETLLSAGTVGADALNRTLREQGLAQEDGLRVRELVEASAVAASATTSQVQRGWLAGITGALKS